VRFALSSKRIRLSARLFEDSDSATAIRGLGAVEADSMKFPTKVLLYRPKHIAWNSVFLRRANEPHGFIERAGTATELDTRKSKCAKTY
jgi:imidazoleglycerol phosphate synthase glutamine amidotransferase subunit HisH